jgi:hypothetical protein
MHFNSLCIANLHIHPLISQVRLCYTELDKLSLVSYMYVL